MEPLSISNLTGLKFGIFISSTFFLKNILVSNNPVSAGRQLYCAHQTCKEHR